MALSHNAFIRGFNSIYQQAPRLREPADKTDFAGYCIAWADCVATHHHYEETEFFPNIDRAAGRTGLMDGAVHEHEAFQGGLQRFKKYLEDKGADFSAAELIALMDEFKEPLHSHLKAEPPAIVALAKYSTPEKPIDILGIADAAGEFFWGNNKPNEITVNVQARSLTRGSSPTLSPPLRRQEASHTGFHVQHSARLLSKHGDGRVRRRHVARRVPAAQGPGQDDHEQGRANVALRPLALRQLLGRGDSKAVGRLRV